MGNVESTTVLRSPISGFYVGSALIMCVAIVVWVWFDYLSHSYPYPSLSYALQITAILGVTAPFAVGYFWSPRVGVTEDALEVFGQTPKRMVLRREDIREFERERNWLEARIVIHMVNGDEVTLQPLSVQLFELKLPFMMSWQDRVFEQLEAWAGPSPLPES